jgi:hypothetical protein
MYCAKCGKMLQDGVSYCSYCGAKVEAGPVPAERPVHGTVNTGICFNGNYASGMQQKENEQQAQNVEDCLNFGIIPLFFAALSIVLRVMRIVLIPLNPYMKEYIKKNFMLYFMRGSFPYLFLIVLPVLIIWFMRKKDQGAVKVLRNISLILVACQILSAVIFHFTVLYPRPSAIYRYLQWIPGSETFYIINRTIASAGHDFENIGLLLLVSLTELFAILTNVFAFFSCREYGIATKQQH